MLLIQEELDGSRGMCLAGCGTSLIERRNITGTVSIVFFLFFVVIVLPDLLKEVSHKSDDQLNTYLYFHQVFLELTAYYLIIKKA